MWKGLQIFPNILVVLDAAKSESRHKRVGWINIYGAGRKMNCGRSEGVWISINFKCWKSLKIIQKFGLLNKCWERLNRNWYKLGNHTPFLYSHNANLFIDACFCVEIKVQLQLCLQRDFTRVCVENNFSLTHNHIRAKNGDVTEISTA